MISIVWASCKKKRNVFQIKTNFKTNPLQEKHKLRIKLQCLVLTTYPQWNELEEKTNKQVFRSFVGSLQLTRIKKHYKPMGTYNYAAHNVMCWFSLHCLIETYASTPRSGVIQTNAAGIALYSSIVYVSLAIIPTSVANSILRNITNQPNWIHNY